MLNDHPHIDLYLTSSLRNFYLASLQAWSLARALLGEARTGVKAGTPAEVSLPANTLR